jgi:hypothetical protein
MKTKFEQAASSVFSSEAPFFLRGEPFPIRRGFHPGHCLCRFFAPALTLRLFPEPAGPDLHLNRKHRKKEAPS